jgi:hypothetical protein
MDLDDVRRRCQARLHELDGLPWHVDASTLARWLAERRGRPIILHPLAGSGPCGVWVPLATADHVFYEQHTSPLHQEHIILHELSHLILGHHPDALSDLAAAQLLVPHLAPELVRAVLQRSAYADDQEQEAEVFASLLLEHRGPVVPSTEREAPGPTHDLLERLGQSLEGRLGAA